MILPNIEYMDLSNKVKSFYGWDIYELTEEENKKLFDMPRRNDILFRASFYPKKTFYIFEKGENLSTTSPVHICTDLACATDYCRRFARTLIGNKLLYPEVLEKLPLNSWVWIEVLKPESFKEKVSAYYRKQDDYTHNQAFCCGYPGLGFSFYYREYNETWRAYRYEPVENEE